MQNLMVPDENTFPHDFPNIRKMVSLDPATYISEEEKMTTAQLREQARERLENLPPDKIRVAAEFLDYLDTAASRDATAELLKMPGMLEDIKDSAKHIEKGHGKNWRKVAICGGTNRTIKRG
jgi:hypothetical protein